MKKQPLRWVEQEPTASGFYGCILGSVSQVVYCVYSLYNNNLAVYQVGHGSEMDGPTKKRVKRWTNQPLDRFLPSIPSELV